MTTAQENAFHARQARLRTAGQHWQEKLAYGDPATSWEGDRALVMYHEVLTDEILVRYELPDKEPKLVFKVPAEGFDIHKVTALLRDADHRRQTPQDVIDRVDKHNALLTAEHDRVKKEKMDAAAEKFHWALRKDTGNHIAPLTVPRKPGVLT